MSDSDSDSDTDSDTDTGDEHGPRRRRPRRARGAALLACAALALFWPSGSPVAGAEASFTFRGGGWGHGVGMGQYGACGMAAAGADAAQILTHYYRGTAVTRAAEVPDLRVVVGVADTFTLSTSGTTNLWGIGAVGAGGTVTVRRSGNSIVASGAISGSVADVLVVDSGGTPLRVSPPGNRFDRGTLVIRLDAGGGLRAIVQGLSTDAYLRGVGEMSPSWPLEALKAQAIAARTGALKAATRAGRWSTDHDLDARIDGSYIGHDMEFGPSGDRWVVAVGATAGLVVTDGGGLITALYASSTGGHTEHSENVWVSPVPHLRGVPDPHDSGCGNPLHRWQVSFTATQLGQRLGVGPVTAISFGSGAGVSGRVDKVPITFTDDRGTRRSLTGAQVKSALGLRSTLFGIDGVASSPVVGGTPATGSLTALQAHDGRNLLVAGTVRDPDGPPTVYVATRHDGRTTARVVPSLNGYFLDVWPVEPGTHVTCVAVLDHPTGASYVLGCRENVVK